MLRISSQPAGGRVLFESAVTGDLFDAFFLVERFFVVRVSFSGAGGVDLLLARVVVELPVGPVRWEAWPPRRDTRPRKAELLLGSFGPPTMVMVGSGAGSVRRGEGSFFWRVAEFFFSADADACGLDGSDMLPVVTDCRKSGPAEDLLLGRYRIVGMDLMCSDPRRVNK